jgi:hypothetical protein
MRLQVLAKPLSPLHGLAAELCAEQNLLVTNYTASATLYMG